MAQRRVEAVFSGRDAGLSSMMQNLRQESAETARQMLDQANSSTSSAREAVQSYEDQIRAMERRNRVASQSNRIEIDNRKKSREEALESLEVVNPKEQDAKEDHIKSQAADKIKEIVSNNITKREKGNSIKKIEGSSSSIEDRAKQIKEVESKKVVTAEERGMMIKKVKQKRDSDISEMKESSISPIKKQKESKSILEDYKKEVFNQKQQEKDEKLQVEILKEILDAIRVSSRQEITSEEWQEGRDSAREDVRTLSGVGSPATDLSNRLNEENRPTDKKNKSTDEDERTGSDILDPVNRFLGSRDVVEGTVNAGGAMGMLSNPYVAMAAAIIAAGTIGTKASAKREVASEKISGMSGVSSETIAQSNIGSSKIGEGNRPIDFGVSREEYLSQYLPQAAKSIGSIKGASRAAIKQIQIDKGLGLDGGSASQLDRFERVNEGQDAISITKELIQGLRDSGQLGESGEDMTKLNEYIRGFISISEQNLSRFGTTETTGTQGVFRELSELGGNFDREDYTVESTRRLDEGLRGGSGEAKAMKMSLLRQLNPEMGRFELEAEMEKGINSKGFLESVMGFVKNSGGNQDTQAQMLDSITGGQLRKEDVMAIIEAMYSGEADFKDITKKIKGSDIDIEERALKVGSTSDAYIKLLEEKMTDITSSIGSGVQAIEQALSGLKVSLDKSVEESRNADR